MGFVDGQTVKYTVLNLAYTSLVYGSEYTVLGNNCYNKGQSQELRFDSYKPGVKYYDAKHFELSGLSKAVEEAKNNPSKFAPGDPTGIIFAAQAKRYKDCGCITCVCLVACPNGECGRRECKFHNPHQNKESLKMYQKSPADASTVRRLNLVLAGIRHIKALEEKESARQAALVVLGGW